jgi:hypothetical protein
MKPKYKSKMRQKQRERARANRAESKESNKPKTTSAERMGNVSRAPQIGDIGCGERAGSRVY